MKVGFFSNVCYSKQTSNASPQKKLSSSEKLTQAMNAFRENNVELCFCLGNFVDQRSQAPMQVLECFDEIMELINSYSIPFYLVPGPEDYLAISPQKLQQQFELYIAPYAVHINKNMLIIILDGNYRTNECYHSKNDVEQVCCLPKAQIEYLERQSKIAPNCILLVYQNLNDRVPSQFLLQNASEIRDIIQNTKHINLVINGNYQFRIDSVMNGIRYLNIPAMNENKDDFYQIIEI